MAAKFWLRRVWRVRREPAGIGSFQSAPSSVTLCCSRPLVPPARRVNPAGLATRCSYGLTGVRSFTRGVVW